jgi:hypothetical protein
MTSGGPGFRFAARSFFLVDRTSGGDLGLLSVAEPHDVLGPRDHQTTRAERPMRTTHAQPHDGDQSPRRAPRILSTRTVVIAFALVEAALIGWALLSGQIH